jgi:hypothetical protein
MRPARQQNQRGRGASLGPSLRYNEGMSNEGRGIDWDYAPRETVERILKEVLEEDRAILEGLAQSDVDAFRKRADARLELMVRNLNHNAQK